MRGEVVGGIKAGTQGGSADQGCYVGGGSMPLGKAEAQATSRSGERRLCPGIRSKRASAHMLQAGTDLSIEGFKGSAVSSRRSDPESIGDLGERCATARATARSGHQEGRQAPGTGAGPCPHVLSW